VDVQQQAAADHAGVQLPLGDTGAAAGEWCSVFVGVGWGGAD
jgi:hypothetical protein